jgi:iron complex transport system permease protein
MLVIIVLLGLLAVALVASLTVGAVALPVQRVVAILIHPSAPGNDTMEATIVWDMRFGRVLLAALIGAGLAGAGAGLQGLFRNPR